MGRVAGRRFGRAGIAGASPLLPPGPHGAPPPPPPPVRGSVRRNASERASAVTQMGVGDAVLDWVRRIAKEGASALLIEGAREEGERVEGERGEGARVEGGRVVGERVEGERVEGERVEGERVEGGRVEGERGGGAGRRSTIEGASALLMERESEEAPDSVRRNAISSSWKGHGLGNNGETTSKHTVVGNQCGGGREPRRTLV